MDRLQSMALTDYNNYSYRHNSPFEGSRIEKMHPLCKTFYEQAGRLNSKQAKP